MKPLPIWQDEKGFEQAIVDLATLLGWKVHRVNNSRRSPEGWPDLFLVHPERGEFFATELKSDGGRLTKAQGAWLDALGACNIETHVWRPYDWKHVEARLKGEVKR